MIRLRTLSMAGLGTAALLLAAAPASAHGKAPSGPATLATGHGLLTAPVPGTTTGATARARFEFIVRQVGTGPVRGHTEFQVFTGRKHLTFSSRTESTLVATPATCTLSYAGTGREGRTAGYTYAVTATYKSASCTGSANTFAITITPPAGSTQPVYTLAAAPLLRGAIRLH